MQSPKEQGRRRAAQCVEGPVGPASFRIQMDRKHMCRRGHARCLRHRLRRKPVMTPALARFRLYIAWKALRACKFPTDMDTPQAAWKTELSAPGPLLEPGQANPKSGPEPESYFWI